jgi:hypothetical protein
VIAILLGAFDKPGRKALAPTAHSYISGRPKWWRVCAGERAKNA